MSSLKNWLINFQFRFFFKCFGGKEGNIGYAVFYCNDHIGFRGFLSMIVVKDPNRYRGGGSKLLEEVLRTAKNEGMRSMALEVAKSNVAVRKFYRKHGFFWLEI